VTYWFYFWTACFVLGGSAFLIVALVVLIRGTLDLREMLLKLRQHHEQTPARGTNGT
jgi:hypothetical protein